ncbi:ankyrin repeat domain-containing protein 50 [Zea mays]|jgi:ankyrin repeat protein|uniref:Ankyrin repeat domain-containing protein 50 n=1 Tax=Zea mays TaxID=4577 RepID=B6SWZ3_MAIZE|nr:ankyrin repeat domain-containing protein 50 [Zea mays]ACG29376.1 ankyrin repeat domain-containing protein 50 [Zea mays]ACR36946.1 unknown [Zea mays]ONM07671.1 Ankyrin repeat family protein [Zea mays]|eukprot:NP_001183487.1 ankyrin repeat domain-containing protein 50 [Zea mays]
MDRLVIPEPSNEVVVRVEPGRQARGELTLRNAMHTMPVAFRLQPAVRGRFAVRPHTGILAPLAAVTVDVLYLASAPPEGPSGSGSRGEDAFLLHSVVAPGAAVKEPVTALDSVNPEWFSARSKQVFVDSGIRASFVGASVAARLVEAGAVEALREVLDRSEPEWRAADATDESGRTLLDLAVGLARADIVQVLLEYGADADKPSRGRTPLETAAAAGECLIAELLLANGATPAGSDAIHVAAAAGHNDVLKLLLARPASASPASSSSFSSSLTSIDAAGRDGKTPLRLAAEAGRRDAVKALLAAGARADARCGADGATALHAAARRGDEAVARLLLSHGVSGTASVRDVAGKTAFEIAAEEGHGGRILDFLGLGEAILAAARKGEVRSVRRAADGGASVEGRDAHGWTPLIRAAFKGRADTVRDLIDRGADIDAADADGYTALHCAAEAGRADVVDLLLKNGANVKAMTVKGRTAADAATASGKSKVVRLLDKATIMGRKQDVSEKVAPAVAKGGSMDRKRRARKGSSGAIRFGGGKEGFEAAAVTVGWSH